MNKIIVDVQTGEQTVVPMTEAEIAEAQANWAASQAAIPYTEKRAKEYPDYRDYLDGIVKGDDAQVQAYIDACKAVKEKYPK